MHGRPLLIKNPTSPRHPQRVTGIDVGQGNAVTLQKSMPTQLTLWQTFLPGDPKTEDYSNTVELYDAVPKYFAQIPPNYVVVPIPSQRKPPEVRICRLSIQSDVGMRPPSTSTPH
jgi:hypothetical protein